MKVWGLDISLGDPVEELGVQKMKDGEWVVEKLRQ